MAMEDPTGVMLMAAGGKPEGKEVVDRIVIERGQNGGVVVRVSKRPEGGSGGELPMMPGVDEMNAFDSWPSAQEFVSQIMGGDASPVEEVEEEEPLLEESEPIEEASISQQMDAMMPPKRKGPDEFAGQRSYSR